jgi:hypothetical protein
MRYHFKTSKGVIYGVVTQQGEGYLLGERVKKTDGDALYLRHGKYTTCNLAEPHFAIHCRKMKTVPGKYVVTGPFHLELNSIPTPLGFIFGMFPIPKRRSSGIIFPTYGESIDRGFYLRDGGLYLAVNNYIGATILGQAYTKGGYGVSTDVQYNVRYRFTGQFNVSYNKVERELDNLEKAINKDYWVRWSHTPQTKGTSRFSASVNAGSSTFNRLNSFNTQNYLSTTFNSNVSYSKTLAGTPFSMGINLRHNQNVQTKIGSIFPEANLAMNRIFPFKKKNSVKKNIINQTNFSYNFNTSATITNTPQPILPSPYISESRLETIRFLQRDAGNEIILTDTVRSRLAALDKRDTLDLFGDIGTLAKSMQYGATHRLPVSTNITIFKYLQISPSFNYTEYWYPYKLNYTYIPPETINALGRNGTDSVFTYSGVLVDTIPGFARAYDYNYSASMTTRMYAFYYFKSKKVQAIRHMITPSVGFSYRPDFSDPVYGFYQEVQIDTFGRTQKISKFQGSSLGGPGGGRSGSLSFGLDNQIEMKVFSKKDSTQQYQKMPILENLSARTSYNLAADSFQLANISLSARTTLFKKLGINTSAVLDPYNYIPLTYNETTGQITSQRRTPEYAWNAGKGLGTITSATIAFGTSFRPQQAKKKTEKIETMRENKDLTLQEQKLLNDIKHNPSNYVDFDIPWSFNFNFNLNYVKQGLLNPAITQTLSFSGDVSLTEKFKIQMQSGYDFERKSLSFTSFSIFRDLHCWQMALNWIPFGPRQSFNLDISVKASMLQDLRISRRNVWFDR